MFCGVFVYLFVCLPLGFRRLFVCGGAQEKLAVMSSILIGGMAMAIPGYYYATTSGSDHLV